MLQQVSTEEQQHRAQMNVAGLITESYILLSPFVYWVFLYVCWWHMYGRWYRTICVSSKFCCDLSCRDDSPKISNRGLTCDRFEKSFCCVGWGVLMMTHWNVGSGPLLSYTWYILAWQLVKHGAYLSTASCTKHKLLLLQSCLRGTVLVLPQRLKNVTSRAYRLESCEECFFLLYYFSLVMTWW